MRDEVLESLLLERLTTTRVGLGLADTLAQEGADRANSVAGFVGVGIDTNILKQFRRQPLLADKFSTKAKQAGVTIIVPAQSVTEYWNNHLIFARDDFQKVQTDVSRLEKAISGMGALAVAKPRIDQLNAILTELVTELEDATAPGFLKHSASTLESLLSSAIEPHVSRSTFAPVASVRQATKFPPGFADETKKGLASLGDFFVWCDFLLGALYVASDTECSGRFLFITDDDKPDWKTGGGGHPALLAEFRRVVGHDLTVGGLSTLTGLVNSEA